MVRQSLRSFLTTVFASFADSRIGRAAGAPGSPAPAVIPARHRAARPRAAMLLAPVLLTFLAGPALAQVEVPRTIAVTGEAERRVTPDMAVLNAEIIRDNMSATAARADADATVVRVREALSAAGISADDIDSTGINIAPQYRWLKERGEQQLIGYRVARTVTVRVLDLANLGELLVALSEAGVDRMQPPRLGLQDEEGLYRETLAAAAANARARAETLAAALNERLGGVQSLSVRSYNPPRPMAMERMMVAADAAAPAAESYEPGMMDYRIQLDATFSLQ